MNYYQHHIGDYAAATSHLTLIEDAVFTRLLRRYYLDESPLPADVGRTARLAGARTNEEIAAVDAVLREFFQLTAEGWRNKRADEEIAAYRERAETARENGKRGGRPANKPDAIPAETHLVNSANPVATGLKANQEPITNNQQEQKQKHVQPAAARFAEFWAEYPVKKGRAAAETSWRTKGCDAFADEILAHVRRMKNEDSDWQRGFQPHGSTYVNGQGWLDEPKRQARDGPPAPPSKHLQGVANILGVIPHDLTENRAVALVRSADRAVLGGPVPAEPRRLSGGG